MRYGSRGGFSEVVGSTSVWWRDLVKLDGRGSLREGWLSRGMVRKLGDFVLEGSMGGRRVPCC